MVRYYSDGVEGLVIRKAKAAVTQIVLRELNPYIGAKDWKQPREPLSCTRQGQGLLRPPGGIFPREVCEV